MLFLLSNWFLISSSLLSFSTAFIGIFIRNTHYNSAMVSYLGILLIYLILIEILNLPNYSPQIVVICAFIMISSLKLRYRLCSVIIYSVAHTFEQLLQIKGLETIVVAILASVHFVNVLLKLCSDDYKNSDCYCERTMLILNAILYSLVLENENVIVQGVLVMFIGFHCLLNSSSVIFRQ